MRGNDLLNHETTYTLVITIKICLLGYLHGLHSKLFFLTYLHT